MIVKASYSKKFDNKLSPFQCIDKFIAFNTVPIDDGFRYVLSNLDKETLDQLIKEGYIKESEKQFFDEIIKKPLAKNKYYTLAERDIIKLRHRVLNLSADVNAYSGFWDSMCIAYAIGYTGVCGSITECMYQMQLLQQANDLAARLNSSIRVNGTFFIAQKIYSSIYTYKVYKIKEKRGYDRYVKYKRIPKTNEKEKTFKQQDFINFMPAEMYKNLRGGEEDFFPSMAHAIVGTKFSTDPRDDKDIKKSTENFSKNYLNFISLKYKILSKIKKFIKKPFDLSESEKAEKEFGESLACEGADKLISLNLDLNNLRIRRNIPKGDAAKEIVYDTKKSFRSIFGKYIKKKNGTMGYGVNMSFGAGPFSNNYIGAGFGAGSILIDGARIRADLSTPAASDFPQCVIAEPSLWVFAESNRSVGSKNCDKEKPKEEYKDITPGIPAWSNAWNIKAPKGRY